jgi:hypothetical protein
VLWIYSNACGQASPTALPDEKPRQADRLLKTMLDAPSAVLLLEQRSLEPGVRHPRRIV